MKIVPSYIIFIVGGLAYLGNASSTKNIIITIITIRGASFLLNKLLEPLDSDSGKIINFASYCLLAGSFVMLIKNASLGLEPITNFFGKTGQIFSSFNEGLEEITGTIEKIMFWRK